MNPLSLYLVLGSTPEQPRPRRDGTPVRRRRHRRPIASRSIV